MQKQLVKGFLLTVIALMSSTAFGGTITKVNLNGNKLLLQQSPFMEKNYTYIPLRALSNNMGIDVDWDSQAKVVTLTQGFNTIQCAENSTHARVNNEIIEMPVSIKIVKGTTYVPVRFISEIMGAELGYDSKNNVVDIQYKIPEDIELDRWGRIIRRDNLPKNVSDYSWILKGVPNDMYEQKFDYQNLNWYITPQANKDYYSPANVTKHEWVGRNYYNINEKYQPIVEKNLDLRLNVNYKNINQQWIKDMVNSYVQQDREIERNTKRLTEYMNYIKKNKVTIEGDYYVEPSMHYIMYGGTFRCWVRFKVNSPHLKTFNMFNSYVGSTDVKTGVWYSGYCDINMASHIGNDTDGNWKRVDDDRIVFSDSTVKIEK